MLANNLTPLNVKCTLIKLVTQGKVGIVRWLWWRRGCDAWRGNGVEELHVGGDDKNGGVAWRWSGGCRRMIAVVWWRGCGGGGETTMVVMMVMFGGS
ncbi:hypothetical protein Tco_0474257 [Tanacetum coccineum]